MDNIYIQFLSMVIESKYIFLFKYFLPFNSFKIKYYNKIKII